MHEVEVEISNSHKNDYFINVVYKNCIETRKEKSTFYVKSKSSVMEVDSLSFNLIISYAAFKKAIFCKKSHNSFFFCEVAQF